jgi:hypothetical protein
MTGFTGHCEADGFSRSNPGDCRAEFTLSSIRFFAEPVLSNTRSFPFTSFRVRMTGGEGLRMTKQEGLAAAMHVSNKQRCNP